MSNLSRRAAGKLLFAAPTLALIPAVAEAREAGGPQVHGRNVTMVQTSETRFSLGPMRQWIETGASDATFQFTERMRDEWSVYLSDESRGVRLQLDLKGGQVLYADEGAPAMRPLYAITSTSAAVNGRNVIFARVGGGRYIMTSPSVWIEQGNDGVQFTFTEERRDDRSVYLLDASRGVRLQIDVRGRQVLFADQGAPQMRPLYPITATAAIMS